MAVMTKDGALFPDSIFVSGIVFTISVACNHLSGISMLAIDWEKLSSDDTVVDIGGNLGTVTLTLAKTFEKPQFVIQDLGKVIGGAKGVSIVLKVLLDS
jgi:tRNA1(Val) A37 N6-methylase TrmN6